MIKKAKIAMSVFLQVLLWVVVFIILLGAVYFIYKKMTSAV